MNPIIFILVAAYIFYRVFKYASEKQEKAILEKRADIEDCLTMIEEYDWKTEDARHTLNFAKMTYTYFYCVDDFVSESEYILTRKSDNWHMALINSESCMKKEVINSQIMPEYALKYPTNKELNDQHIAEVKAEIAGKEIKAPELLNIINSQLNIYNEKKAALLRKIS